jgi:hypothetical protein
LLAWMQPRDPAFATKLVAGLVAVGVVVTVGCLPVVRNDIDRSQAELVTLCGMAAVCLALVIGGRWLTHATRLAWALCPFLAVAAVVLVDLATFDASLAAQVFFLFPALYAATLLPWRGAALVTAAALLGEVIVA